MNPEYTPQVVHAVLVDLLELRALRLMPTDEETPETHRKRAISMSLLADVESALPYLPPHLRLVVYCYYERGLSQRCTAEVADVQLRAVQKRLAAADLKISQILSR